MKLDDSRLAIPDQQVSIDVLLEKYAKGDEQSVDDVRRRVARALAAVEKDPAHWEPEFFEALRGGFIPGGRINSAAGTDLQATLINCFVQPVGDSVSKTVDGKPGIYVALMEAAETMRRGGGVGYDFSSIRPRGALVRGTHSQRERAGVVHARVRPQLRDGRVGRRAARRADGHPALRSSRHRGIHPRQGRGRPAQLQRQRGGDRRLHARGRERRRLGTRAQVRAGARRRRRYAAPARRRPVGLPHGQGARSVAADHAVDLRSRRARRGLHRPHERTTTICRTARRSRRPIPAASSRCRPTAAAASAAST